MIAGDTVGIMTKDQLEKFKGSHGKDKFIEVDDKDVTTMDKNELKLVEEQKPIKHQI